MSKHTIGPWEAQAGNTSGQEVIAPGAPKTRRNVARCGGADRDANARLIAAAPDMLAALEAVNKLVGEGAMTGFNCHDGDWAERLFLSQQATSAAIKKAGGRLGSQRPARAEETSDA